MDVLIVGAGSAGSVLAERLSADDSCSVTVLEAGPGPADPLVASQITDALRLPIGVASTLVRRYQSALTDAPRRYTQLMRGRVVGGSGAVNGGYFCRALPSDLDGWGIDGWTWADVLPHFKAIETDLDFPGPIHGSDGPIRIRRVAEFDGCTASFVDAAREAGFDWIDDLNGSTPENPVLPGVGAVPLNIDRGTRVGPGGAFLEPALRRPNLTVRTETRAVRLRMSGGRAIGVDCVGPDGAVSVAADRIVVSAGAIASAQLLMLSGIGPEKVLRAAGVAVAHDLPVGVDIIDHPEWVLPVTWPATHGVPPLEAVLTTGDGVEIRPYTAGFGAMTTGRRDDPTDQPHIGVTLMSPQSRGRVRIVSPDPDADPVIEQRYDSAPADVELLRAGTRLASELAGATVQSAETWSTSQHLCGTAKMGAVVDERCRVYGVQNLWVVDGSILPQIPSRGPHATIVMAGHRAAEFVGKARRHHT
ncbi:mycofactocin system GMC family oxidoreductase MftG [Mycolicibacterium iranicum]|uniref:Glucose-methanol-choline oxidoreductase n=1 Tax=Mycolicibacterium iranicum TaxID=912594 RepID=A0A178LQ77_MYCIR|nr:mycofactocin system GMC family oxidoreductase MftG [Mycolicibacterium iranicum]OAN34592.1 glucose-methanol-choline oxidoreductase [Mycolicibacterium iranicum]